MIAAGEFLEQGDIVSAFVPVDMQTGANNGTWINLANYNRVVCVLFKGIGTAGQDPVFTMKQAKTVAGGSSKDLTFTRVRSKVGATAVNAIANWTLTTQAAAATATVTDAAGEAILAVEFRAADLDVQNGFSFVQMSIPDTGGNAQLGAAFYLLIGARYAGATMPTAIA